MRDLGLPQPRATNSVDTTHSLLPLVVHEFREPIQAIQALVSVVLHEQAGPLTELQHDFLSSAYTAVRRLARLVNDVQVMAAHDEGFSMVPDDVDLLGLVAACRRELELVAREFEVGVDVTAAGTGSWRIWADPIRIEQIILNLVENAIRYSSRGTTIRVRLRQSPSRVLMVVENQSKHDVDGEPVQWFHSFARGTDAGDGHPRGVGLGLAIVSRLVQAHDGHVTVRVRGRLVAMGVVLPRRRRQPSQAAGWTGA